MSIPFKGVTGYICRKKTYTIQFCNSINRICRCFSMNCLFLGYSGECNFEQLLEKAINRFREAYLRALNRLIADCELRKHDIEGEIRGYIDVGIGWRGFTFPHFANPLISGH